MGLREADYHDMTFGVAWTPFYDVGTNSGRNFLSVSTLIYATEDCWVQCNTDNHETFIRAGVYFTFERQLFRIRVRQATANGTIYLWFEGNRLR